MKQWVQRIRGTVSTEDQWKNGGTGDQRNREYRKPVEQRTRGRAGTNVTVGTEDQNNSGTVGTEELRN